MDLEGQKSPAGHGKQEEALHEPGEGLNEPAGHGEEETEPSMQNEPAGHCSGSDVDSKRQKAPAGHGMHDDEFLEPGKGL